MGRLLLILVFVGVIVAFAAIIGSFLARTTASARRAHRKNAEENILAPTQLQKIAYVALLVLLTGVSAGWLGGL
ncbi:hypothetical protein ABMC89_00225 [Sulfitobacter sp. HNIBRBA3233]|uniref:hypothetical protein n=1 Tax=Sulfitobacter marinivivus TaxID=3158558 RepID=UPI0032DFC9F8